MRVWEFCLYGENSKRQSRNKRRQRKEKGRDIRRVTLLNPRMPSGDGPQGQVVFLGNQAKAGRHFQAAAPAGQLAICYGVRAMPDVMTNDLALGVALLVIIVIIKPLLLLLLCSGGLYEASFEVAPIT